METILITGGAGFIGSSLADKLLSLGCRVIVIDNFSDYYDSRIKEANIAEAKKNSNYKLYRADIENIDDLQVVLTKENINAVVHLAARAGVRLSVENPSAYIKTNVLGTANLLEAMHKHHVKKLVFASSSSVYGNCKEQLFSEDIQAVNPISPYAASKISGEQLCYVWHKLYDMQVLCLRLFTVYGPRQRPDLAISKFIHLIKSGKPIEMYGDGKTMRDYTYISDVINGIIAALSYNKTAYEIVNIGGGKPINLKEMIGVLESALGIKSLIRQVATQAGDVEKTACNYSKANRLFGYKPKVSFCEGINMYLRWLETQEL